MFLKKLLLVKILLIIISLLLIISCEELTSNSDIIMDSNSAEVDISKFKLDSVRSLFRGPDMSDSTLNSQDAVINSSEIKYLYILLENGKLDRLKYTDNLGEEKDFKKAITNLLWISKDIAVVEFSNNLEILINLQNGSILNLKDFDLKIDSIVHHSSWIFGFTKDLKTLKRISLHDSSEEIYHNLPENKYFMTGTRIPVAYTTLWWDDEGYTPADSINFRPMLIDKNLNVLAQINDEAENISSYYAILFTGEHSLVKVLFNNSTLYSFFYSKDFKLYSINSFSGPYIHLFSPGLNPEDVDITLSEVHITVSGLEHSKLSQFFPFSGATSDTAPILCRNDYTINSEKRYTIMGLGVLLTDATSIIPSISMTLTDEKMNQILIGTSEKASNTCFISGDWIYFRNAEKNKILRGDLTNPTTLQIEEIVNRSEIESFDIIGDWIYYSTNKDTYKVRINGADEVKFSSQPGFKIKNLIQIK